jgi:hypothetical protein
MEYVVTSDAGQEVVTARDASEAKSMVPGAFAACERRSDAPSVPEFTLTVSTGHGQELTGVQLAAELRRVAGLLERETGTDIPDFSGEWHDVHATGAVVSHAFWGGLEVEAARGIGIEVPASAYRPWRDFTWERLDAPWPLHL